MYLAASFVTTGLALGSTGPGGGGQHGSDVFCSVFGDVTTSVVAKAAEVAAFGASLATGFGAGGAAAGAAVAGGFGAGEAMAGVGGFGGTVAVAAGAGGFGGAGAAGWTTFFSTTGGFILVEAASGFHRGNVAAAKAAVTAIPPAINFPWPSSIPAGAFFDSPPDCQLCAPALLDELLDVVGTNEFD